MSRGRSLFKQRVPGRRSDRRRIARFTPARRARLVQSAGTLTHASKMPGPCAPSLPAGKGCPTGARLMSVPGSPCASCYAARLQVAYPSAGRAWERNLEALRAALADPAAARLWVYALAALLLEDAARLGETRVRWFVSGDLQNARHLALVLRVARLTPALRHRIPTQEQALLKRAMRKGLRTPANVRFQVSTPRVDRLTVWPQALPGVQVTSVSTGAYSCPASAPTVKACGGCDLCWRQDVATVTYRLH